MAQVTNTFSTYDAVGEREDLSDIIYSIAPTDTPFMSGIAKEQARAVLPEGMTGTTLYMAGTLRSWIHYCRLRMANGTQLEHAEIAKRCWDIIGGHFPSVREAVDALDVLN